MTKLEIIRDLLYPGLPECVRRTGTRPSTSVEILINEELGTINLQISDSWWTEKRLSATLLTSAEIDDNSYKESFSRRADAILKLFIELLK